MSIIIDTSTCGVDPVWVPTKILCHFIQSVTPPTRDHSDEIFISPPRQDHCDKVKKFVIYCVFTYILPLYSKFYTKAIRNSLNFVPEMARQ